MRALAARIDEHVLGDAMTWLARRRQAAGDWPDPG
jgi:hypothetical protein